jgi:hypothetical protein
MTALGTVLRQAKAECGASLGDLTVLSPQSDPFRLDTPAHHAKARWFRDRMDECGLFRSSAPIHNRGIHYAIVSLGHARLPDSSAYLNNAECWAFLEEASNTARWLRYVPWEKIFDARNAEPVVRMHDQRPLTYTVNVGEGLFLPDQADLHPRITADGFDVRQPFRLVLYGEKTSLGGVLGPLAERYGADLYLPSGEISNSLLARMARSGHEDGREMVVFIFADCDPAGYQMAASIGHKLRALAEGTFPGLRFRVLAPALTVEQVKHFRLPSTPLKETELRAAGWRQRYGVEQTEIDALATLRPDLLRAIVAEAADPFFDHSLAARVSAERERWEEQAQAAFEAQIDGEHLAELQAQAEASLEALQEKLAAMEQAADDVDLMLPPFEPPQPRVAQSAPEPLVSSGMGLVEHIRALRARKDYSGGAS